MKTPAFLAFLSGLRSSVGAAGFPDGALSQAVWASWPSPHPRWAGCRAWVSPGPRFHSAPPQGPTARACLEGGGWAAVQP